MRLDDRTILDLCHLEDKIGVLSVYVGITPDRAADPQPTWTIDIRNRLRELRQQVKNGGPRERWVAVHQRLDAIEGELAKLLDASSSGRGRALFATMGSDRLEVIRTQLPFRDRVLFEDTAYVRPLVAALDEGRAAGIVTVSRTGARVLEWRLGVIEEIERHTFPGPGQGWREQAGPSGANPTRGQEGLRHRERYEDRLDENRHRFLRSVAHEVGREVGERGWDRLLVAGEPRLTNPLSELLDHPHQHCAVLTTEHLWEDETPDRLAEAVWEILTGYRRTREVTLATTARDRALSGNAGAVGVAEVLTALNEGRVEHLLFDDGVATSGYRSEDGLLFAGPDDPAARDRSVREEPLLVERMIERAFETRARVTPVEGAEATDVLAPHDGVAALLRW